MESLLTSAKGQVTELPLGGVFGDQTAGMGCRYVSSTVGLPALIAGAKLDNQHLLLEQWLWPPNQ